MKKDYGDARAKKGKMKIEYGKKKTRVTELVGFTFFGDYQTLKHKRLNASRNHRLKSAFDMFVNSRKKQYRSRLTPCLMFLFIAT